MTDPNTVTFAVSVTIEGSDAKLTVLVDGVSTGTLTMPYDAAQVFIRVLQIGSADSWDTRGNA